MDELKLVKETILELIKEQKSLRAKVDALETLFFASASFIPIEELEPILRHEVETHFSHDLNAPISDETIDVKASEAQNALNGLLLTVRRIQQE